MKSDFPLLSSGFADISQNFIGSFLYFLCLTNTFIILDLQDISNVERMHSFFCVIKYFESDRSVEFFSLG